MLSSATTGAGQQTQPNTNDRVLTVFGMLAAHLGSFGVMYFWLTGAILLFTGNGGQMVELTLLTGVERWLFLAYPAVVLISLFGWVFFALKRDLMALGLAGLPVVYAILYYFYFNTLR